MQTSSSPHKISPVIIREDSIISSIAIHRTYNHTFMFWKILSHRSQKQHVIRTRFFSHRTSRHWVQRLIDIHPLLSPITVVGQRAKDSYSQPQYFQRRCQAEPTRSAAGTPQTKLGEKNATNQCRRSFRKPPATRHK